MLVDAQKSRHQRLSRVAQQGYLADKRIITNGDIVNRPLADIEDLFAPEYYLLLFNQAFKAKVKIADLKGTDQIVAQIERVRGSAYDHGRPADLLLRKRDERSPSLPNRPSPTLSS